MENGQKRNRERRYTRIDLPSEETSASVTSKEIGMIR